MPQKIKNKEIQKFITKIKKNADIFIKICQDRERMNKGFEVIMNNEYGEYGWDSVDFNKGEVTLKDELKEKLYTRKNPKLENYIEFIPDIEVETIDRTDEVPAEQKEEPTQH